tara:strand:+ start:215 stop:772 length:558 start_codon:yes stop_codon:yes gene_type:complete
MLGSVDKNFKFKKVTNFLTKEEIELFSLYSKMKHRFEYGQVELDSDGIAPFENSYYADLFTESLLLTKRKKMEEELGAVLLPTYSFYRLYTYGAELKPHTDRESCEISVTIKVDSDGEPWTFYADGEGFDLNNGDAVIYKGREVKHWRNPFKGDWHSQIFLHYVDQKGPFASFAGDNRQMIGQKR